MSLKTSFLNEEIKVRTKNLEKLSLTSIFSPNIIKALLSKKQLTILTKLQLYNKAIVIILRHCTNKVFEREYINQISNVAKTAHSYLIQFCHAILKDFL